MPSELPRPPLRVFAKCHGDSDACWWMRCGDMRSNSFGQFSNEWHVEASADELTPIDHPENDPEAIKIIEDAARHTPPPT